MEFITRQLNRVGKQAESFQINFKPTLLKVAPYAAADFYVVFQRGIKKETTKKYHLEATTQMQHVKFDDSFTKVSGFYKEKDGSYQPKKAQIIVRAVTSLKDDKICEVTINLASYIGRGTVSDSQSLSGSAFFIDFEISVEAASKPADDDDDSGEEGVDRSSSGQSPGSHQKNSVQMTPEQRHLQDTYKEIDQTLQSSADLKYMIEQMQAKLAQAENDVKAAEEARQEVLKETAKRREVEAKWIKHQSELEAERNKIKKEIDDYYDADRDNYEYN